VTDASPLEPQPSASPARVLWLIKGLDRGGAERLLTLTAAKLDRDRFEVEVAYVLTGYDGFVPELQALGVRTHCLGAARTLDPGWVGKLYHLIRAGDYALIHTHSPLPAVVARGLTRAPARLVHTEHNLWGCYRWPTYVANAATYGRNEAVIAVSDGVAASIKPPWWARRRGRSPVEVLLHGVNPDTVPRGPEARTRARDLLGLASTRPVVGIVANLSPKKDHAGLLTAIDQVRTRVPDVLLLLIGSGPLEDELRARVAADGLRDHVRFLGSRDDVAELLPALDVFVLGSRFEGLPIALLEAMAAELPCVATAVGGVPEALTDGVEGRLVPPGDPRALATALEEVLGAPGVRAAMGSAARRRVRSEFSIDRAVRRTEELYAAVLWGGSGGPDDRGLAPVPGERT
jgi:glycosyltransferase involved in cell wall biosynthesis